MERILNDWMISNSWKRISMSENADFPILVYYLLYYFLNVKFGFKFTEIWQFNQFSPVQMIL